MFNSVINAKYDLIINICCKKDLSCTKSVEASTLVQSKRNFSQHMNENVLRKHIGRYYENLC